MKMHLLAAVVAAATLPAASFTAEATVYNPYVWGGWYGMACDTNDSKYIIPKYGIVLKNSGHLIIPKGTIIGLKVWTKTGYQQYTINAPREMARGESVRVAQPSGAFRCQADARVHKIDKKILTRR